MLRSQGMIVSSLLVAITLSACQSTKSGGSGGLFSRKPPASATYIAALQGGIIGRSGVDISDSDLQRALEAEYRALEYGQGGQATAWKGDDSGTYGQAVAAQPYRVGSQDCRQYTQTVVQDGQTKMARGTACRNGDGSWTPLT